MKQKDLNVSFSLKLLLNFVEKFLDILVGRQQGSGHLNFGQQKFVLHVKQCQAGQLCCLKNTLVKLTSTFQFLYNCFI